MADYYANNRPTTGGAGTLEDPYDIRTGTETLRNGDTLYLRGGTYDLNGSWQPLRFGDLNPNPAPSQPSEGRTIMRYQNEEPVLDATNIVWSNASTGAGIIEANNNQHYSVVDGVEIRNIIAPDTSNGWEKYGFYAVYFTDYMTVKNCKTYNTQSSGIFMSGGANHLIDNNEVELFTTNGNHEGITLYAVNSTIVSNNYVHDIGNYTGHSNGIGIDFKNGGSNNKCFNNRVANCTIVGIYLDARGGTSGLEVHNNEVFNIDGNPYPTNHGIVVADELPADGNIVDGTRVYNNIVIDCGANGIVLGWTAHPGINLQNTEVVNNVCHNNTNGMAVYLSNDGVANPSANNIIANNILWGNTSTSIVNSGTVSTTAVSADTNIMDGSVDSVVSNTNPISDDPLFVDEANYDFHLQDGSPGIGTGTNAYYVPTEDYDGNPRPIDVVDIGAYENQEGETMTGNFRLTGKAFSNKLGIMKRALTVDELTYLDTTPTALGIIANGGTDVNLPNLTQADFSNYVAFDEGVGTAHDDITASDYTLDDGAVWVEL